MLFPLTEEQRLLQQTLREFVARGARRGPRRGRALSGRSRPVAGPPRSKSRSSPAN